MQVYISTNCLSNSNLVKTISLYAGQKLGRIELSSCQDVITPSNLNRLICRYPASYLVHNYFPSPLAPFVFNLASENPEINQKSLDLAKNAIKLCKRISSPFYSFHGGFLYDAEIKLKKTTQTFEPMNGKLSQKETALNNFYKNLTILQKLANENNIQLLIENNVCPPILKNKLLFVDHQDFRWLFSQRGMGKVGVLLDTGHLKVSASTYGFPVQEVVKKLENKIIALHLHDNNGKSDLHQKIKSGSWIENLIKEIKRKNLLLILEAYYKNLSEIIEQKKYLESL